jgi:hypothetical protein
MKDWLPGDGGWPNAASQQGQLSCCAVTVAEGISTFSTFSL